MKKNINRLITGVFILASLASCQDIKDTYADYAGDGEIRYVGECKDLTIAPGWERLIVKWTNNIDPIIEKVKVRWSNDDMADSILLDRGTTEYSIPNLGNDTYQVTVCSLDKNGNSSIGNTIYGRPYTTEHEEVKSFSRVIAKHFLVKNHLVLLFSGWAEGLEDAYITYTKQNGEEDKLNIDRNLASLPIYELPEAIQTDKPITLYRKGKLSGCNDLIQFDPYNLEHNATYTANFKEFARTKYGEGSEEIDNNGEIKDSWANHVETFELDTDMDSFEDLFNFPKLKKLILGKNRYLTADGANDEDNGQFKVYSAELSDQILNILNKYNGLAVERYNKHYADLEKESYIKEMGLSKLPSLSYYDLSKASISVSPEDEEGYNSHLSYLIDGKDQSCWKPLQQTSMTSYQIIIKLNSSVSARGVKIVQKTCDEYDTDKDIMPQTIKVEIADDNGNFQDATHVEENSLGRTSGETILLPFAKGKQTVRYIRLTVPSLYYHKFYAVTLAEVGLYK